MIRSVAFVMLLAVVFPAMAQEKAQEKTFTLTQPQLQTVVDALVEMPYKRAAPVIQSLAQQLDAQSRPPAPVKPDTKPDVPEAPPKADSQ